MSGFAHYPVSKATLAAMMPHLEVASPQGVDVSTSRLLVAQETNYCRLFPDHFSLLKMLTHLAPRGRGAGGVVVAGLLRRSCQENLTLLEGGLGTEAGIAV